MARKMLPFTSPANAAPYIVSSSFRRFAAARHSEYTWRGSMDFRVGPQYGIFHPVEMNRTAW